MELLVTRVSLDRVLSNPGAFNTKHHGGEEVQGREAAVTDAEYERLMQQTTFSAWSHALGVPVQELRLQARECRWLLEAGRSGILTKRIPNQLREELEAAAARIQTQLPPPGSQSYFVRLERCSLKDGALGVGPFKTGMDIVTGLATSWRSSRTLSRHDTAPVACFLLPWRPDMDVAREFRCFVHKGRTVAVSQYDAYTPYTGCPEADLPRVVEGAIRLADRMASAERESFTMDVLFRGEDAAVELVELNSFGAQLAAGSALFHWITDYDRLHGRLPGVEVRIVVR